MSDSIHDESNHEIQHVDPRGIIASPEEIARRKKTEEDSQEKSYRDRLLDAETRQANAQNVQASASRSIVFLTSGLVMVSLISGLVSVLQFKATNQSAKAAKSAADTAKDTRVDMNTGAAQTKDQIDRLIEEQQRTANAMEGSLKTSRENAKQTKTALDASIKAFQLDQRPWVTVQGFSLSSELESKTAITVSYSLHNTGKTPALDERSQSRMLLWGEPEPPFTEFPELAREAVASISIISPGPPANIAHTVPWIFDDVSVATYRDKKSKLYIHIRIGYRDQVGKSHWTTVCAYRLFGMALNDFVYAVLATTWTGTDNRS